MADRDMVTPEKRARLRVRKPAAALTESRDLRLAEGPGTPLEPTLSDAMSFALGADLSRVRLHADRFAAELTEALGAEAVTQGEDVFFAPSAYDPISGPGRARLAHELYHVVHSTVTFSPSIGGRPHDEVAARDAAERFGGRLEVPWSAPGQRSSEPLEPAGQAARPGQRPPRARWGVLGRKANTTLSDPESSQIPDVLTAETGVVRLVTRLLERDGADLSGRIHALLGRMGEALRTSVVDRVAEGGGVLAQQLERIASRRSPVSPREPGQSTPEGQPVEHQAADREPGSGQPLAGEPAAVEPRGAEGTAAVEERRGGEAQVTQGPAETQRRPTTETAAGEEAASGGAAAATPAGPTAEDRGPEEEADEKPPAAAKLTPAPAAEGAPGPPSGAGPPQPGAHRQVGGSTGTAGGAPSVPAADAVAEQAPGAAPTTSQPEAATLEGAKAVPVAQADMMSSDAVGTDGVVDESMRPLPEPAPAAETGTLEAAAAETSSEPEPQGLAVGPEAAEAASTVTAPVSAISLEQAAAGATTESAPSANGPEQAAPDTAEPSAEPVPEPQAEAVEDSAAQTTAETGAEASEPSTNAQVVEAATSGAEPVTVPVAEAPEPATTVDQAQPAPGSTEATVSEEDTGADGDAQAAVAPVSAPESGMEAGPEAVPAARPSAAEDLELRDPRPPSGGGGGGSPIPDPPRPTVPDVSGMPPAAAMKAVSSLPASMLSTALPSVTAAVQSEVGSENEQLAANPPAMPRPSGVPSDKDASLPPALLPPLPKPADHTVPPMKGGPGAEPPAPLTPPPAPLSVVARVREVLAGGEDQVSHEEAARVQGAVKSLPTTDPALYVDSGPVPELVLQGHEDPAQVDQQSGDVEEVAADTAVEGLTDARAPMGENDVLPHVPEETLTATLPETAAGAGGGTIGASTAPGAAAMPPKRATGPSGTGGAGGPGAASTAIAVDAIAAEQGADQVASAAQSQGQALTTARADHDSTVETERANTDKSVNEVIAANGSEQTATRKAVRLDVGAQRMAWVTEQNDLTSRTRTAADEAQHTATATIQEARTTARSDASGAIRTGNDEIKSEREKAEETAREKRRKAEAESDGGGFFSWIASKVKRFFNAIKEAIHAAFDLARKAVDAAIKAAQKVAVAAIELGRRAVVAAIELGGKALAAAGDIALAGFPKARAAFRAKIEEKVEAATKKVNELADGLKKGVTKLLDALGQALTAALTVLEKAYTAAVDAVANVVNGVLKAAQAFVDALGAFLAVVGDIAVDPIGWLKNLAAGIMDGVRNHVWPALVTAVKTWFKRKVEDVVGVGAAILAVLRRGGITFAKVVSMAWTAIKESLPGVLVRILIEKLVAMLIPAAGALSVIIDGIKAAWGAAQSILAAFRKFITFLKAIRPGQGGPAFGDLVGAAAVAVIDFVSNFVLVKLKGAGSKVGGTLRRLAEKFMRGVKKTRAVLKRGAKAAVGLVKRGAKAAAAAVKRGATAVVRVVKKGAGKVVAVGRMAAKKLIQLGSRAAKATRSVVSKGIAKVKRTYAKAKERLFGKKPKKPKETPERKLARVVSAIQPTVEGWFDRGIGRVALGLGLAALQARHLLRSLGARGSGDDITVFARVNPGKQVATAWRPRGEALRKLIHEVGEELLADPDVQREAQEMNELRPQTPEEHQMLKEEGIKAPVPVRSGSDYLAAASHMSQQTNVAAPGPGSAAPWGRQIVPKGGEQEFAVGDELTPVTEVRGPGKGPRTAANWLVKGIGAYFGRSSRNEPSISEVVASLRGPDGDAGLARDLTQFMQAGVAPDRLKGREARLSQVSLLMFSRETSRNPAHAVHAMMTMDLVQRGVPMEKALKAMPLQMPGAQESSRGLIRETLAQARAKLGLRPAGPRSAGSRALARREIAMAEQWLAAEGLVDSPAFKSRSTGKTYLLRRLRDFYRKAHSRAGAGGQP